MDTKGGIEDDKFHQKIKIEMGEPIDGAGRENVECPSDSSIVLFL
jgi:hypothetical protein